MEERGLTITALGKRIGYTPFHLSRVLNGHKKPGPKLVAALAKTFRIKREEVRV